MTTLASRLQAFAVVALMLVLAGCDSDNDNDNAPAPPIPPVTSGIVEVIHASADAPPVNVFFDDVELVSGADYKDVAVLNVPVGDAIRVRVDGIVGGSLLGTTATVIPADPDPEPTFPLAEGDRVTIIAWDEVAEIKPLVLIDNDPEVPADTIRARVIHAAPGVPGFPMADDTAVEVWLTEPGADLDNPPMGTINAVFSLGEVLAGGPIEFPAGTYQIRATIPGDTSAVAYDSGPVTLAGGSNLVILAVPNTNAASDEPISLLVATGAGSLEIQDEDTDSNVRVLHASSDAPEVGVLVNGADSGITVDFNDFAEVGPVELDPGVTNFNIGLLPDPAAAPVLPGGVDVDLIQGGSRLAVALGSAAPGAAAADAIRIIAPEDSIREIATDAQVRIIHASVVAQNVNIYVLPENSLMMGEDIPAGIDPVFPDVPLGEVLGHISLPPGNYDIAVTPVTSRTPAIGPFLGFPLPAGSISTIVAVDGPNQTTPLGVVLIDDTL